MVYACTSRAGVVDSIPESEWQETLNKFVPYLKQQISQPKLQIELIQKDCRFESKHLKRAFDANNWLRF